tara:strand:- start:1714 stop:2310 length:597 start_codon:yes stop_codon:yes gene_type:complete
MSIENKILKYVEGNLKGQIKEDFENLIKLDSDLRQKVEILSDLYKNSTPKSVPDSLKENIYNMLDIKNDSIMNIILEKSSDIFNILSGHENLIDANPLFITRNNNDSLLFSKEMNNYKVFCEFFKEGSSNLLSLKALNANNEKSSNIKFILKKSSNVILEKYTDSNGNIDSFEITNGNYVIDVNNRDIEIGSIKISIS